MHFSQIPKWIKPLFFIAGVYEATLGVLFSTSALPLLESARVSFPSHVAYIQFPALLLIVFAIMFFSIARDPVSNKNLVIYGIMQKLIYSGVVLGHWVMGSIPWIWVPFAFVGLIFLILFIRARIVLKRL